MSDKEEPKAVLEITEEDELRSPFWRVLRPNGTRSYPDGGQIRVRNDENQNGRFRYRFGEDGEWQQMTIRPGTTENFVALQQSFYLKNTGNVDLQVDP